MNTSQSRNIRSGFTLVELLVVITIMIILARITFPIFAKVRENARRATCQSNLKQLTLGFLQYTQDSDDQLPGAVDGAFGANKTGGWAFYSVFGTGNTEGVFDPAQGRLYSYVKNAQIYVCPSDARGRIGKMSYAANACVFEKVGLNASGDFRPGKKVSKLGNSSSWMLLTEEARIPPPLESQDDQTTDDGYLNLQNVNGGNGYAAEGTAYQNFPARRHLLGANVAFLDGHVKWYTLDKIKNGKFRIGGTGDLDDGCPE